MMSFIFNLRSKSLIYLFFIYSFIFLDLIFFLNPELIVNVVFLLITAGGLIYYYYLNQKDILVQRNEMRKKGVTFNLCYVTGWRKFQLRRKYGIRIFIDQFLRHLFSAFKGEVSVQKKFLGDYIEQFIIFNVYKHMRYVELFLNNRELIKKRLKGLLLSFWFINKYEH